MYDILTGTLVDYFNKSPLPFHLPFSIIADKDESHHRKRLLIGLRLIDPDSVDVEKLVSTVYLAHPPAIDQSGSALAKVIAEKLIDTGISSVHLGRSYRGLCADGGIINVNLSIEGI